VGQLQLLSKCTSVVKGNPLIIPGHFIDLGTASNDFPGYFLLVDQTSDLASAQNTLLKSTGTGFARTSECAAVVHTVLVSDSISTAIVGDAHVDLLWVNIAGPEKLQRVVNLLEIRMRFQLGTETWDVLVPCTMEVVGENAEPINMSLEAFRVHIFHVVVLSWNRDTEAKIFTKGLSHLFHELDLISPIIGTTTTALMSRPLPIKVNTTETPL
jgi:hypothetical protein